MKPAPIEVARTAWAGSLPDWVEALALECGRTSQN
ncbi:MAG: transcriptional regulator, partial [Rhodobacter sp.]|nr:transcriptional regulator [Rhodobacter sp.]